MHPHSADTTAQREATQCELAGEGTANTQMTGYYGQAGGACLRVDVAADRDAGHIQHAVQHKPASSTWWLQTGLIKTWHTKYSWPAPDSSHRTTRRLLWPHANAAGFGVYVCRTRQGNTLEALSPPRGSPGSSCA
jgi:hypothetical protein